MQTSFQEDEIEQQKKNATKMTKHSFLDKIKSSAAANTAATKKIKLSKDAKADEDGNAISEED